MINMREKIAYLLLAIYGIVFAHNVIPHHHHNDLLFNLTQVFEGEDVHGHMHICKAHDSQNVLNTVKEHIRHEHNHEDHEACHFDVRPVVSKTLTVYFILSLVNSFKSKIPVKELPKQDYIYYPQKLLESYNFAVPLRAPPFFL